MISLISRPTSVRAHKCYADAHTLLCHNITPNRARVLPTHAHKQTTQHTSETGPVAHCVLCVCAISMRRRSGEGDMSLLSSVNHYINTSSFARLCQQLAHGDVDDDADDDVVTSHSHLPPTKKTTVPPFHPFWPHSDIRPAAYAAEHETSRWRLWGRRLSCRGLFIVIIATHTQAHRPYTQTRNHTNAKPLA